jgi:hypothetical protein
MNTPDLEAVILSYASKDLVSLELDSLQDIISDYHDDQASRLHHLCCGPAKSRAIVKIGYGIIRPPWATVRSFFSIDGAQFAQFFLQVRIRKH